MRKMFLFMMVSLDGFFEGNDHDLSWHHVDDEFNTFAAAQMQEAGVLLFGRRTYQLMRDFWPSYHPEDETNTIIRDQMNTLSKIVFSRTLEKVEETKDWKNIELFQTVNPEMMQKLKTEEGKDLMVLGSSSLCVTLLKLGLLDELRIMVNPIVIGEGTRLFVGLNDRISLKLTNSKRFTNGNMLLYYDVTKNI